MEFKFSAYYYYKILDKHWGDMLIKYNKCLLYHDNGAMPLFKYPSTLPLRL